MKINSLRARAVLDSRGNPTVEVEATNDAGTVRAIVPSGASTGTHEARELRDGGTAWNGQGVDKAVKNVNTTIAKAVRGKDFPTQASFDGELVKLDGTAEKKKLGANAILAVSMAYCRLAALEAQKPLWQHIADTYQTKPRLPVIFANVLNGGKHAASGMPFQEFMIVPTAKTFVKAVEDIANTYHALKDVLANQIGGEATLVGDEGGFAPKMTDANDVFDTLERAAKAAGAQVRFAMDAAASEFYTEEDKSYKIPAPARSEDLAALYEELVKEYDIVSIEDPFEEEAFGDFAALRKRFADRKLRCQIVGDDLTVTNVRRIKRATDVASCDCLLLKVNQIGTVTEAVQAAVAAQAAGWKVMVSHRSGETDDAFISHLAVGLGTGQIKIGAPCRGERTAKYNELLRISEQCSAYKPL